MTRVCMVGAPDTNLRYELVSRETAREALNTYDLTEPFENALALETISLGAAVSLLNDLDWYLVRFVEQAWVLEPSVDEAEWLSRPLAAAVRNDRVAPEASGRHLAIYGVIQSGQPAAESAPELTEPMYVARTGRELPEYDLAEVDDTVLVRVTAQEFGGERS